MAQKEQSFANHTRFDPLFHRFLIPVAALMVIATIVQNEAEALIVYDPIFPANPFAR